jgi:hypothetical protein
LLLIKHASGAERIDLRNADLRGLQRSHRAGGVEPDLRVKLLQQAGSEVNLLPLELGYVDAGNVGKRYLDVLLNIDLASTCPSTSTRGGLAD